MAYPRTLPFPDGGEAAARNRRFRPLWMAAALLLWTASPALSDPDIAGKLDGAADFRSRPSHAVLGRGSLGVSFVDVRKFLGRSAGDLSEHCDTSLGVNDGGVDEPFTPEIPGVGAGTYRFTGFWRDETEAAPAAAGWALSFEQDLGERAGLFLRYAGVDEEECDLQQVLGTGVVLRRPFGRARDWIGFAFMWGDVSDESRSDEYALETYWRIQLTERLEFTPDLQIHVHPDAEMVSP